MHLHRKNQTMLELDSFDHTPQTFLIRDLTCCTCDSGQFNMGAYINTKIKIPKYGENNKCHIIYMFVLLCYVHTHINPT